MKFRNAVARHLSTDPEQQIAQVLNPGEQNTTRRCLEQPTCPQQAVLFLLEKVAEGARHDTPGKESVSLIVFVLCLGCSLSNAKNNCPAYEVKNCIGRHVRQIPAANNPAISALKSLTLRRKDGLLDNPPFFEINLLTSEKNMNAVKLCKIA